MQSYFKCNGFWGNDCTHIDEKTGENEKFNWWNSKSLKYKDVSYDSITIPASGYVSLKKNGLSLSNIRMASIITYSRIDPPKPFCVYGNSTVAYVYGEPGTVITELKVRFWYWLNSNKVWKKFESYNIPTGNGIEINIPNNTKEIMIFVGCKNAEQVYGGKSYILKTSATIVYEKEIYSAADNLVGTGFYAVYKNNDNKLVMKCKTSNTLFAIVYIK